MIKKTDVLKQYRISKFTFDRLVNTLPEADRNIITKSKGSRFFDKKQADVIKQSFGDWSKQCFKTKYEMAVLYNVSFSTFKKMLFEAFGKNHILMIESFANNFYTAKQVELIEQTIGEP